MGRLFVKLANTNSLPDAVLPVTLQKNYITIGIYFMHRIAIITMASLVALASGCASTENYGPKARAIDYDEASAFERSLQARDVPSPQMPKGILYTQPVNKKEPCKLPTTQDQLARSNFRTYWDGQCKDGYAYGLGRDIAISDTHHVEEITTHNGSGNNSNAPRVLYDFVNNKVAYTAPENKFPQASWFQEHIFNSENQFRVLYKLGVTDESGNSLVTEYSPLNTGRMFLNDRRNVVYKIVDNSAMPVIDAAAVIFTAEIIDPQTKKAGGVAIVRHGNGQVRHVKLTGALKEDVLLPAEYTAHLKEKYSEILNAQAAAHSSLERARRIEREYLYMACNGKHEINGLDKQTATKICTWRDQFKAPYKHALEKYALELERLKHDAESAKQQHATQQQIAQERERLQQQQVQQGLQQGVNALGQMGQQMQFMGQQMLQNSMNQPAPQVDFTPWTPSGSNQIRCINTGSITNCRY